MKALVYAGPRKVEVREVAEPGPRAGAVKVGMRYCGVCGSDIGIYAGKHPRAKAPLVLGHEFVGVVEEGNGSGRFTAGDRVVAYPLLSCGTCLACRTGTPHVCRSLRLIGIDVDGGMAESAWIDEGVLFKVPGSLSDKAAAVVEPLAVIVHALHQARFKVLDSAVITGAGPIGILTGIVLKQGGASRIVISDIDEGRLEMCRAFGFETVNGRTASVVDYVAETTGGEGMDLVFECSGSEGAAAEMTKLARIRGTICMTGVHKAPHAVDLMEINFKEQTLVGTRVYTQHEFGETVAYAATIGKELEAIVTQVVPLTGSEKIFEMIADPAVRTVKVLVDCRK